MEKELVFSVIVPVYNVAKYLPQCIDSILHQTYESFELILVDDGSTDASPEICDAYSKKDSRIKVVHKTNGGLSDARNRGISEATGQYICFLDSDDYWIDLQGLEKLAAAAMRKWPDLIQFGARKYYQTDCNLQPFYTRDVSKYDGLKPEDTLYLLVKDGQISISACLMAIRREFLLQHELLFKKGIKTEDLEWAIRVYVHKPSWVILPDAFYIYRMQREGSITATIDFAHMNDYCNIISDSLHRIETCETVIYEALMSYIMYHALIASALSYRVPLTKQEKVVCRKRLSGYCADHLLQCHKLSKKVAVSALIYRITGYGFMAWLLGFYLKHRGR